jgi:hypothetical protein
VKTIDERIESLLSKLVDEFKEVVRLAIYKHEKEHHIELVELETIDAGDIKMPKPPQCRTVSKGFSFGNTRNKIRPMPTGQT